MDTNDIEWKALPNEEKSLKFYDMVIDTVKYMYYRYRAPGDDGRDVAQDGRDVAQDGRDVAHDDAGDNIELVLLNHVHVQN